MSSDPFIDKRVDDRLRRLEAHNKALLRILTKFAYDQYQSTASEGKHFDARRELWSELDDLENNK